MERLSRMELLYGAEALQRLRQASFMVCGLGGVGSWAAEALVRSGAGKVVLVDFDCVQRSNINRQAQAMNSTLGEPKCEALAARLKDIAPDGEIIWRQLRITAETIPQLLNEGYDAVIDAIDDRAAKIALLSYCHQHGVKVISSMGAANKVYPDMVRVGDISTTDGCPFAKLIRKTLRRQGISSGIQCVYSAETPVEWPERHSLEVEEEPADSVMKERRPMGSVVTVTAVFGMICADQAMRACLQPAQLSHRGNWRHPSPQ